MKTSSAKNKGRKLQKHLRELLIDVLGINEDDVLSRPMGSQGEDLILSPKAREKFPFSPECKNREKVNVWESFKQADDNAPEGIEGLLVLKRNNSEVFAMLRLTALVELIDAANQNKKKPSQKVSKRKKKSSKLRKMRN